MMIRFLVMVVVVVVVVTVTVSSTMTASRADDATDVKLFMAKIDALEAKLEAANLKIEKLQKENDELRASSKNAKPVVEDGFGVGTKLSGRVTRTWVDNGKQLTKGNEVEVEVTNRSGKNFTGEYWADGERKTGAEIEGTIDGGVVKFTTTKALGDFLPDLVGLHAFTGRFDKGELKGTTTKKGEPAYKAAWIAKVKKD